MGRKPRAIPLAAEWVTSGPCALAHALHAHRARFRLTEAEQRRRLGVRVRDWTAFQLCGMPETAEDLDYIAMRFGADRERLERAVRTGE
jgi:hypothetical protein